jgi:hypothetical protein
MPAQVGQVTGSAPPAAPVPSQTSQGAEPGTWTVRLTPLNASSSVTVRL